MPGVTKEQIAKAKEWDLLSYLQTYEPNELKKCGPNEYCTVSHESLKISKGLWCWNGGGIGGKTALDYLIKVRDLGFVEAVEAIAGGHGAGWREPPPSKPEPPPKPFALPSARRCGTEMVSYLLGRGIDSDIINRCISIGILYESYKHHNCVFVGKDPAGVPRFACVRGTGDRFRIDVEGSDKRYNFCLYANHPESPFLAVAESPIDALSIASIMKLQGEDWTRYHYLSLGGTSPRALLHFLHTRPWVTHLSLCLDNDKAGLVGIEKLQQAIRDDPELSKRIVMCHANPPPTEHGKDYNDFVRARVAALRAEKQDRQLEKKAKHEHKI